MNQEIVMFAMRFRAVGLVLILPLLLTGQGPVTPEVLSSGSAAYRSNGARAAVSTWLSNSFLERDSALISRSVASLREVEKSFGSFVDLEVVGTSRIGSRVTRNYAVLLYERGPMFVYFDTYRVSGKTIVTGFLFDPRPDAILPS